MRSRTQEESEQLVKTYQLDAVESKVDSALIKLDTLITQTSGTVSRKEMEEYVEKEIADQIAPLIAHKNSVVKLGWLMLSLIIADIATRIFGFPK